MRRPRDTIAASDLAQLLEAVGVQRRQVYGFFDRINLDVVKSLRAILSMLLEKDLSNILARSDES